MSRNEWEKGKIVIPTAQWAGFKKALRDAHNTAQTHDFDLAKKLFEAVKVAQKGKRNVDWQRALNEEYAIQERQNGHAWGGIELKYRFKLINGEWGLHKVLLSRDAVAGAINVKIRAPMKKDFSFATSKTMEFPADDGGITLVDAVHAVVWDVGENNHAVESARESHMGKVLFNLLSKVAWTRGSGGALMGNDEYNEDSGREYAGGGGSYITSTFGPLGDYEKNYAAGLIPYSKLRRTKPRVTAKAKAK